MSRGDAEWQRIVRDASARGRTAESIGLRWDAAGFALEEHRYRRRLSPIERRHLDQAIIDAIDKSAGGSRRRNDALRRRHHPLAR